MKELSTFCHRMTLVALLLTTVSATKMNVPRLRLSYKGKIHSTTFIWSHLCFLVSYIDYSFIFKCFIISTTSKTRMGRNVLTDLGLQLGNNAIIILPNRLFIFNYVSSFENRFWQNAHKVFEHVLSKLFEQVHYFFQGVYVNYSLLLFIHY